MTTATAAPTLTAGPAAVDPVARRYNRPLAFYAASTLTSFVPWSGAAYLSHLPEQTVLVQRGTLILGVLGLGAPAAIAAWLVHRRGLWADVRSRLLWRRGASRFHIACAFGLLLVSLLVAQAISLLFGYSAEQFLLRDGLTFSSGLLPVWSVLVLAPVLEELAWHGYGTDALLTRMRLFPASMVFTVFWTLWHAPLAFIKGYYHSEVVAQGWLHALNFPLSMIPFVLIMNWLYYRTGRSITVAIVFHITAGFVNEIFLTHPDSKLIQTAVLLVVAAVVVVKDRELFFGPRPVAPRTLRAGATVVA